MIKVLHVIHSLQVGGMEGRVARLAHGLHGKSCAVSILCIKPVKGRTIALPPGVEPRILPIASGLHPLAIRDLGRAIAAGGYDIVHTHNWGSMLYGILAARYAKVPVVLHGEHGINFEDTLGISRKRLWAQRWLAGRADRIVTVNRAMADSLGRSWGLPAGKAVPILNGVDVSRFKPPAARAGNAGPVIGTVGRLDKVKNLPLLARGFAAFRKDFPGARLLIVGEGPMRPALEAEREGLGLGDALELAGDVAAPETQYARMDAFVNSSFSEGMSNTILEAMAMGLPVIASDVEGNKSWLRAGENALFFRSGEAGSLAGRLRELASDPAGMRAMGERNRARAEAEFDNRLFLEKYLALYRSLVPREAR